MKTVGQRLIESAKQARDFARGEPMPHEVYHIYVPPKHPPHRYTPPASSHMAVPDYKYQDQTNQSGRLGAFEAVVPRHLKLVDKD